MNDHQTRSAPNYTSACIVMFGVNLGWILFAVWALWGLIPALVLAFGLNRWLDWLRDHIALRRGRAISRGK